METPQSADQVKLIMDTVGIDPKITDIVTSFALAEFRRGWLMGQRDMKQRVENAVFGLKVEES